MTFVQFWMPFGWRNEFLVEMDKVICIPDVRGYVSLIKKRKMLFCTERGREGSGKKWISTGSH